MRLERLEINGFKSFSDRAELAFDEGVTAIVGPNGCGKSNVADAITWVLGEQSAKSLRGDKMEDVIFNGSDARRPGSAAEVRLRLSGVPSARPAGDTPATAVELTGLREFQATTSAVPVDAAVDEHGHNGHGHNGHNGHGNGNGHNGHGNGNGYGHAPSSHAADLSTAAVVAPMMEAFTRDVEVTRRLYRSGESEYLINGEVCRLRDVHELLMDTGLGAKAYAIIEQGKIGLILSSRPADRRQLIEEAAGITKYKSRRRSAELKLEAAQQNLTRIDDIVFEVERQRGTLKRQAAKARRYRRLREELRRWEKVLFARRYRELAEGIALKRDQIGAVREREAVAAARVAEVETALGRLRIEQAEADAAATRLREAAHTLELDINRRQQQIEFDRHQAAALDARATEIAEEVQDLLGRREPARIAVESRRQACQDAERARDEASAALEAATQSATVAQQDIQGLETRVEGVRRDLFAAMNAATALRHVIDHAVDQRGRVGATLGKLDVEEHDVRMERQRVDDDRATATDAVQRARQRIDAVRQELTTREAELVTARQAHESQVRAVRTGEQECAALEARLHSLEELVSTRGEFGDAARMVLVQADGHVGQQGAVADYLDVDRRYERAVEACLGDLLQYVIVDRHEQAAAGLSLVREHDAGRCGFVVVGESSPAEAQAEATHMSGVVAVRDVVRIGGPHAATIQRVLPEAYIAETFEQAVHCARATGAPVATVEGDVLRGAHLVTGGAKAASRGILATKREIKELRERVDADRGALARATSAVADLELVIAAQVSALAGLQAELHRVEKDIVGYEAQLARATDDGARIQRKADVIAVERTRAEEERAALDARHAEAVASIGQHEDAQRRAEQLLAEALSRLQDARDTAAALAHAASEARATHAGLQERATGLAADVGRLEDAARDLEVRIASRTAEGDTTRQRRSELLQAVATSEQTLDADVRSLDDRRAELRVADGAAADLRATVEAQDAVIREARHALDAIRVEASDLEVARATAEADLAHLAQTCVEAVQATLDDVRLEVEEMERAGAATPDAAAITADDADVDGEDDGSAVATEGQTPQVVVGLLTAEDAIAQLKLKIERLGPVNMMAIEQFDELETRHAFLTTQRKDLVDSIAQTADAIARIDATTKARFTEAFAAIQRNFQVTFSTLFGGGHAGLTLLDENDPLESGIDIVASPPGKRLQSVQLLSGGEKALTAIALMFAIFKYKPSPFCLLDEIDAPLDDANVSRFVEMLRGMLSHTQFILITHNRRTMEIANRLYGVTMEEPGVSKLISVHLH